MTAQRVPFTLSDLSAECTVQTGYLRLDDRPLGLLIAVPTELHGQYPYNASAYALQQQLRAAISAHGIIEFPGLPVNPCNHTLAQRSPWQHSYSTNPYLTDLCQLPHQDTPPYPTAFWLGAPRRFSATWVMSGNGLASVLDFQRSHPGATVETVHRHLVAPSLSDGSGLLLNQYPGLLLIDNSQSQGLYHARTCRFDAVAADPDHRVDTPMYAYNEVGLLHYIDQLDSRRGPAHRDALDEAQTRAFLAENPL